MMRTITGIIRDPIWQFVGVVIGIVALVIALLPFMGKSKSLQIVILSNSSLVKIDESVANEFSIPFQDKSVESLDLITIKLENVGKQSIRPENYETPITITFPEPSIVIDAKVVETFPPNIPFSVIPNENEAALSKSLINKGEKIILEFKVINLPSENKGGSPFSVSERIYEISDIPIINAINDEKILFDPAWQISVVILSIIAIAISLLLYVRGLQAASLRIKLVENIKISELADYELDGLNLTYHGKNVENLSRLVVEIQNTGNKPILGIDYLHPIIFKFHKSSQVIDAKVSQTNPSAIITETSIQEGNAIEFSADLLNPRDSVVLNFMVSNAYREKNEIPFFVSTRIIGLRSVTIQ